MKKVLIIVSFLAFTISGYSQFGSWWQSIFGRNTFKGTILVGDDFSSTSINTDKWTITNPNPTYETLTQNGKTFNHLTSGIATATGFANKFESKNSYTTGVFKFSISVPYGFSQTVSAGIYVDNINYAALYFNATTYKWDFYIRINNAIQFQLNNVSTENGHFKISVNASNEIKLFVWNGKSWVQKGTTTTANIGSAKKFREQNRCNQYYRTLVSMDDIYITDSDYSTFNPIIEKLPTKWKDVRQAGAKGDSITDDAPYINAALQLADTVIIQHGTFRIGSSLLIPSNKKLVVKGATILSSANTFDNIVRNADTTGNTNIKILGLGNATFHQNCAQNNDGINKTHWGKRNYNSFHYIPLWFVNCSYITIDGIAIYEPNAYSVVFQHVNNSSILNTSVQVNTTIGNQGTFGIGFASHDITINNLAGKSLDDFVAIEDATTADFQSPSYRTFFPDSGCSRINISNVNPYFAGDFFRIIACDNHTIDSINIVGANIITASLWPLVVGQTSYCQVSEPVNHMVRSINIDQMTVTRLGTSQTECILLASPCQEIYFTNFVNNTGKNDIRTTYSPTNIWINGTQIY